jgi:hypothetical protein
MTPQAQPERYAARVLRERDESRVAGDALAGEMLQLACLGPRYPNTRGLLLTFAVETYVDTTGWMGPAATLIKEHRSTVHQYVQENMLSLLQSP